MTRFKALAMHLHTFFARIKRLGQRHPARLLVLVTLLFTCISVGVAYVVATQEAPQVSSEEQQTSYEDVGEDVQEDAQQNSQQNGQEDARPTQDDGSQPLDEPELLGDDPAPRGEEPRGANLQQALNDYLTKAQVESSIPALAAIVVDADSTRAVSLVGDVANEHAVFTIGSLSKSITAVGIMKLVEKQKVLLDLPVSTYLPEYQLPQSITVRSLLNQTSGLGYYDTLAHLRIGPWAGEFSYSNANYDLLGKIIERTSNMSYAQFVRQEIFIPLGMFDSYAGDLNPLAHSVVAPGHRTWFGIPVADGFTHVDSATSWGSAASGYIHASIKDMGTYLQMYLNQGAGLLERTSVEQILYSGVDAHDGTRYNMGWTSFMWDDGEIILVHDGDVENYVASMTLLPKRHLGVVVLGSANDYLTGNASFWSITGDVLGISLGVRPSGVDMGRLALDRVAQNALLAFELLLALSSFMGLRSWGATRPHRSGHVHHPAHTGHTQDVALWQLVMRLLAGHVLPSMLFVLQPYLLTQTWRDIMTFIPDEALVWISCAVLLSLSGLLKVAVFIGSGELRRTQSHRHTFI